MIASMRTVTLLILTLGFSCNLFAREDTLLDSGWRFKSGDSTNAAQPAFDDGDWQAVSIPHNWGWEEAQAGQGLLPRAGLVSARTGPHAASRQTLFSAVRGGEPGGRRLFERRIAGRASRRVRRVLLLKSPTNLSATGTNLLAVRVSNQWEPDIAPLSGDFSVYGGLYRPVHLIETAAENFTPTDHGSPGVAWLQTSVTKKKAVIDVTAQISNGTRRNQSLTLVATRAGCQRKTDGRRPSSQSRSRPT